jgi:hypothetical protein
MDQILTLLIALGGIATGIGAIWTAMVTRHLARATEQSIAEQSQSLREQNERARISLEVDLTYKLQERWDSQLYKHYKIRSLKYVKENYFADDDLLEVDRLDPDTEQIFAFLDELGHLTRTGVLQLERVWSYYGGTMMAWVLWERAVQKEREAWQAPDLFEDMEYLYRQMVDLERQRGVRSERPTKEELRRWVEHELLSAQAGIEPAMGGEEPTKG